MPSTMCRISPTIKNYLIENVSPAKIEKPWVRQIFSKLSHGISVFYEKQVCGFKNRTSGCAIYSIPFLNNLYEGYIFNIILTYNLKFCSKDTCLPVFSP